MRIGVTVGGRRAATTVFFSSCGYINTVTTELHHVFTHWNDEVLEIVFFLNLRKAAKTGASLCTSRGTHMR